MPFAAAANGYDPPARRLHGRCSRSRWRRSPMRAGARSRRLLRGDRRCAAGDHRLGAVAGAARRLRAGLYRRARPPAARLSPALAIIVVLYFAVGSSFVTLAAIRCRDCSRRGSDLRAFARGHDRRPQAVAISTRSSLASLPAMLVRRGDLGRARTDRRRRPADGGGTVPATGPAMNIAVAFYVAIGWASSLARRPDDSGDRRRRVASTTARSACPARSATSPRSRRSRWRWACRSRRWAAGRGRNGARYLPHGRQRDAGRRGRPERSIVPAATTSNPERR